MSLNKPSPNSRFVFPTAPAKEGEEKKSEPDTLAMKREALRKRKEELEKKNEPKPIIEKPNEIIPEKAPEKTEIIEKKPIENGKSELELKRELLKKKKEDLEKKMAGKNIVSDNPQIEKTEEKKIEESPIPNEIKQNSSNEKNQISEEIKKNIPESSENNKPMDKLAALKLKYQKASTTNPQKPEITEKPEELDSSLQLNDAKVDEKKPNKLEELKKKYANKLNSPNNAQIPNRNSEPSKLSKSVSTTHVQCEKKKFQFPINQEPAQSQPAEEKKDEEPEKKEDFLKKLEMMQMGFDKKLDKMKSLDNKNFLTFDPNNSKSMDMGNQKISLSQYKSGLKKNLLIDLEAEQAKNMPKKILTPGGMKIHSTLADRVAGLEKLFSGGPINSNPEPEEKKTEVQLKIEKLEILNDLKMYHVTLDRTNAPKKLVKAEFPFRKRMSKEWV